MINETPFAFAPFMGKVVYPKDTLTLIVKGTFTLTPDQPAQPVAPEDHLPPTGDLYYDNDPQTSVRYDSDFVHYKPRADVCVVGHCHVPGGAPLPACNASFKAGKISKSLMVFGDRQWQRTRIGTRSMSDPEPFTSMQLRYENSFGGPGYSNNPVGKGIRSKIPGKKDSGNDLPNIKVLEGEQLQTLHDGAPAGFGPLGRTWSQRMALVGTYGKKWKNERWPWLPEDFNWGCFNAAPADQQVSGYLNGDETLYFENMHPAHAKLHASLPGIRLRCFISEQKDDVHTFREVKTRLDTLWVDMDALSVVLVWRGLATVGSKTCDQVEDVLIVQEAVQDEPRGLEEYEALLKRLKAEADLAAAPPVEEALDTEADLDAYAAAGASVDQKTDGLLQKAMGEAKQALNESGLDPKLVKALKAETDPEKFAQLIVQGLNIDPRAEAKVRSLVQQQQKAALDQHRPELEKQLSAMGYDPAIIDSTDAFSLEDEMPETPPAADPEAAAAAARSGEDISDQDLSGADFRNMSLEGANFKGAQMGGADFSGAKLAGADFSEASLESAKFEGADLTGAKFLSADLSDARLEGAILSDADLSEAVLTRASLHGAKMQGANLSECQLDKADLSYVELKRASLDQADLTGVDLSHAHLKEASLVFAVLDGADLTQADLEGVRANNASFHACTLLKTNCFKAHMEDGNFSNCRCDEANFQATALARATFEGAVGRQVNFREADLDQMRAGENVRLPGSSFRRARGAKGNWAGADLKGADFILAQMPYCDFNQADLTGSDCRTAELKGAVFDKACLSKAQFNRANLFQTRLEEADLTKANFKGANLYGSEFLNATIDKKTNFSEANLKGTKLAKLKS